MSVLACSARKKHKYVMHKKRRDVKMKEIRIGAGGLFVMFADKVQRFDEYMKLTSSLGLTSVFVPEQAEGPLGGLLGFYKLYPKPEDFKKDLEKYGLACDDFAAGLSHWPPYHNPGYWNILEKNVLTCANYARKASDVYPLELIINPPQRFIGYERMKEKCTKNAATFLNGIGKKLKDMDIRVNVHHHFNAIWETEDEYDLFFELTNPEYVYWGLCMGHLYLGVGRNRYLEVLEKYKDRLGGHISYRDMAEPDWTGIEKYRPLGPFELDQEFWPGLMKELGHGNMDLKAMTKIMKSAHVEIDHIHFEQELPSRPDLTGEESVKINVKYLKNEIIPILQS